MSIQYQIVKHDLINFFCEKWQPKRICDVNKMIGLRLAAKIIFLARILGLDKAGRADFSLANGLLSSRRYFGPS